MSWDNVTGKPDSYPPETHTHDMVQVTGLEDELSSMQSAIANKANSSHTHSISNITNLQSTLNGKASASHKHEIADVTNLQTTLNGKAASSHNHSASNITSGTLPVTRGGTGVTANPSMLVDLNRTTAASVFASAPRPGVIGTLPVARGGTGVTSISSLKSSLGLPNTTNEIEDLIYSIAARAYSTDRLSTITIPIKCTSNKAVGSNVHAVNDYIEFTISSWPSDLDDLAVSTLNDLSYGTSKSGDYYKVTATYNGIAYTLETDVSMQSVHSYIPIYKANAVLTKNNYNKWKIRITVTRSDDGYIKVEANGSINEFNAF